MVIQTCQNKTFGAKILKSIFGPKSMKLWSGKQSSRTNRTHSHFV